MVTNVKKRRSWHNVHPSCYLTLETFFFFFFNIYIYIYIYMYLLKYLFWINKYTKSKQMDNACVIFFGEVYNAQVDLNGESP